MKILAFDTSNQPMSVGLVEDGVVLAAKYVNVKRNHSVQLMPAIEQVLQEAEVDRKKIDRIAVAKGPGSYTGVRIAVTIAKTLAWTLNVDLVGISSLEVLAMSGLLQPGELISPLIDARRNNVYTALYQVKENLTLELVKSQQHTSLDQWIKHLKENDQSVQFVGLDVGKFWSQIEESFHKAQYYPNIDYSPSVYHLSNLAVNRQGDDIHSFAPEYLKLAEAEENWLKDNPNLKRGDVVEKI